MLGLAALAFATACCFNDPGPAAATIRAIQDCCASSWEHFRSAVQLVAEKYVELVQQTSSSAGHDGGRAPAVAPLPLPPGLIQRVDAFLAVAAPKHAATVTATVAAGVAPRGTGDYDAL